MPVWQYTNRSDDSTERVRTLVQVREWKVHCQKIAERFVSNLTTNTWLLAIFAFREAAIRVIDEDPVLMRVFLQRFDYANFRPAVIRAMDRVRAYFREALIDGESLTHEVIVKSRIKPYEKKINDLLKAAIAGVTVQGQQKKESASYIATIYSCRVLAQPTLDWCKGRAEIKTPHPLTGKLEYFTDDEYEQFLAEESVRSSITKRRDAEKKRKADAKKALLDDLACAGISAGTGKTVEILRGRETLTEGMQCVSRYFLLWPDTEAIEALIHAIPSTTSDDEVLVAIQRALPSFGTSADAMKAVRGHIRSYNEDTKRVWLEKTANLSRAYPYVYNLIMAACCMWTHHQNIQWLPLPVHYREGQLAAMAARIGLMTHIGTKAAIPTSVPDFAIQFVLCGVCNHIYSMPRQFSTCNKQTYTEGHRDMRVDTHTGVFYCEAKKTSWNRACVTTPLVNICLVGRILFHKQTRAYLLCPQPGCGLPMQVDTASSAYSRHGIACSRCTELIDIRMEDALRFENAGYLSLDKRCIICNVLMVRATAIHVFARGCYVCNRHFNQDLLENTIALATDRCRSTGKSLDEVMPGCIRDAQTFIGASAVTRARARDARRHGQDKRDRARRRS